ncbi:hypothetical protein CYMTET_16657, partial [Cymbomonas tetramitiformis]
LFCAMLPAVLRRMMSFFPDAGFAARVQPLCLEILVAAFRRVPSFIDVLRKPLGEAISGALSSVTQMELAVHLCWAIGEYGGIGGQQEAPAESMMRSAEQRRRTTVTAISSSALQAEDSTLQLFEMLELALYERLHGTAAQAANPNSTELTTASHAEGRPMPRLHTQVFAGHGGAAARVDREARLLCVLLTAMAKLAARRGELGPRACVCMAKVSAVESKVDARVHARARECRKLLQEPSLAASLLGRPISLWDRQEDLQDPLGDALPFLQPEDP